MSDKQDQHVVKIQDAISQGIKSFLVAFSNDWQDESVYGFLLEISCEGTCLEGVAATEEGLTRIAKQYSESISSESLINEWRIELRWGSPEDGWYTNYEGGCFDNANQLLMNAHEAGLIELYDGQLNRLVLGVLQNLDVQGLFGQGEARYQKAIGICYMGGDNSEGEFLDWLKEVNSPDVVERVRREMEEGAAIYEDRRKS